jgi:ABC-type glycerol-3-phosphate transport system substrate-binding protein
LAAGALDFYTSFSKTNSVWDETQPTSTIAFASGKLAMYIGPSWRALEIIEQNPRLKFKVLPVPQLPKSSPSEPDITYASYWVEGVWERSENKIQAWEFLKFLSDRGTLEKLYKNASSLRKFGEPYPRKDMQNLLLSDPILAGVISLAPNAQSWYLASRTYDGQTGINSRISKYFEDAINSSSQIAGDSAEVALQTASLGVQQVLADYGLIAAPPPVSE